MSKSKSSQIEESSAPKLLMFAVYLDESLMGRVRRQAAGEGRKLAQMGRRLLEEALDAREQSASTASR